MLYFIIIFYIIFLIWKYDIRKETVNKWMHYKVILLIFILVAGLSYRLGVDSLRYEFYFYDPFEYSWDGWYKHIFKSHGEPLFVLTNLLTRDIFGEFFVSRLIMSLFYNTVFFWFVRKHSPAPFTTIFLYALFQYFNFNFQVIRETMAVACFLIGLDGLLLQKPRYLRFFIFILIGMGFHHFSFIALFFPLFFFVKPSKSFLIITVIVFLLSSSVSMIIGKIAELELLNDSLSNRVESFMESSRYGERTISSFVKWVVFLFAQLFPFCIMVFSAKKANPRMVSLALLFIIITILRYTSFGILFRINSYLFFCFAIVVTQALCEHVYSKDILKKRSKHHITKSSLCCACISIMLAYRITFMLVTGMVMYYPYSSVINHELDEDRESFYSEMGVYYKHD